MEPTLQNGNALLLKKWGVPQKGDIVTAYIDELDYTVVKRILAAEGDTVNIDESGVYVNGKWAAESVKNGQNNIDFRVSVNEYFLIGDNLADSLDSRSFGCVGRSAIRGILIKKLFYSLIQHLWHLVQADRKRQIIFLHHGRKCLEDRLS